MCTSCSNSKGWTRTGSKSQQTAGLWSVLGHPHQTVGWKKRRRKLKDWQCLKWLWPPCHERSGTCHQICMFRCLSYSCKGWGCQRVLWQQYPSQLDQTCHVRSYNCYHACIGHWQKTCKGFCRMTEEAERKGEMVRGRGRNQSFPEYPCCSSGTKSKVGLITGCEKSCPRILS